jgi:hypothetical protein
VARLSASPELSEKRLEILKEAFPNVSRVAVLRHPDAQKAAEFKQLQVAGRAFGIQVDSVELGGPKDLDEVFSMMADKRPDALMVLTGPIANIERTANPGVCCKEPTPNSRRRHGIAIESRLLPPAKNKRHSLSLALSPS